MIENLYGPVSAWCNDIGLLHLVALQLEIAAAWAHGRKHPLLLPKWGQNLPIFAVHYTCP